MVKLQDYFFMGLHCVHIQTADSLSVSRQPDSWELMLLKVIELIRWELIQVISIN